MGFSVWHNSAALLVFTLQGEIRRDDIHTLCEVIEERLQKNSPFGILTYAHRATRFASPDVRGLLLEHSSRVRKIERARAKPNLLAHAVWLSKETMPTFDILQMQMGRGEVMKAFLNEKDALYHLQSHISAKPLQKTWDFPFTEPTVEQYG